MYDTKKTISLEAGGKSILYWSDLWRYRELFFFIAWRDVLIRYKQTVIGIAWSLIRPLLTMIVFTVIFGKIANLPSNGIPYPIMVYTALLPWQFFANSFADGSNSLLSNSSLLSKVYFPRLILPASSLIVSFIDFVISFSILAVLMVWYRYVPHIGILLLPVFILFIIMVSLGAGFWISALNVQYRDFKYVVPFIIQFGLFISPVGFTSGVIPEKWRILYSLNPLVGVIDGFRWAILGERSILTWYGLAASIIITFAIFFSGIWYFRKMERTFADII
jgi:lipopolysaccharide transport system permease protein